MSSFVGEPKKLLYFTQIQLYLSKYHHIFTRYSCIYPIFHRICLFISPNNTVFASNIITKPHKMHFSHSYKGLEKCTFLKVCTMNFCRAWTTVHLIVTACMEARTFLKTPAFSTLIHLESSPSCLWRHTPCGYCCLSFTIESIWNHLFHGFVRCCCPFFFSNHICRPL